MEDYSTAVSNIRKNYGTLILNVIKQSDSNGLNGNTKFVMDSMKILKANLGELEETIQLCKDISNYIAKPEPEKKYYLIEKIQQYIN